MSNHLIFTIPVLFSPGFCKFNTMANEAEKVYKKKPNWSSPEGRGHLMRDLPAIHRQVGGSNGFGDFGFPQDTMEADASVF